MLPGLPTETLELLRKNRVWRDAEQDTLGCADCQESMGKLCGRHIMLLDRLAAFWLVGQQAAKAPAPKAPEIYEPVPCVKCGARDWSMNSAVSVGPGYNYNCLGYVRPSNLKLYVDDQEPVDFLRFVCTRCGFRVQIPCLDAALGMEKDDAEGSA